MSDHEFERQVQQKMDELKFSPSAEVWKGVEQQLEKDRDRRRGLIWWPTLFLLVAAGGFLFINRKSETPIPAVAQEQARPAASSKSSAAIPNPDTDGKSADRPARASEPGLTYDKEEQIIARLEKQSATIQRISHRKGDYTGLSSNRKNMAEPDAAVFDPVNDPTRASKKASLLAGVETSELPANEQPDQEPAQQNEVVKAATPPVAPRASEMPTLATAAPEAKNQKTDKAKTNKRSAWSFGFTAGSGMSGMNDGGIANFKQATVLDLSGGINNSAFLPSNTVIYKPSLIKPGIGYSVGGYAERSIGKRWTAQAALNYTRFNQSVMVGRKMNTTVLVNAGRAGVTSASPYYTREPENKFSVHYDFLDLPLSLLYHINPSSKVPVSVFGGVVGSRLLGSNALHFDGSSAGYFQNNDLLNKWQLGMRTGAELTLMNRSKHPVTLGPSFRYQFTNSLRSDLGARRNIMAVGLDARIKFK